MSALPPVPTLCRTAPEVRRALAASFPNVAFSYEANVGRGRDRGGSLTWEGGPTAELVRAAANLHRHATVKHFFRHHTAEELTVLQAEWAREAAARDAAEPARRAAAKAAGSLKAARTRAAKAALRAALAASFPAVHFTVSATKYGGPAVTWTDGPTESEVRGAVGAGSYLDRQESEAARRQAEAVSRQAEEDEYINQTGQWAPRRGTRARLALSDAGRAQMATIRLRRRLEAARARAEVVRGATERRLRAAFQLSFFPLWGATA